MRPRRPGSSTRNTRRYRTTSNGRDDEKFIDAIDPKWSGALPATFIYDRTGKRVKSIVGELSMPDLERAVSALTR